MSNTRRSNHATVLAAVVAGFLSIGTLVAPSIVVRGADAHADTAPTGGLPTTVTADPLPTVQIDGVVWSQVIVGNTVYATGNFKKARPAGTALGSASSVSRTDLLAYNLSTGALITSFNHVLNGQGLVVVASPDNTRIYVGGDFTSVDGKSRRYLAAFDTATGALVSTFAPSMGGEVRALVATNSAVYAGGNFFSANGASVTRLARLSAATGATVAWPATADNAVNALAITPDQSTVFVAGRFANLDGTTRRGIGAVDAATGALAAWDPNFPLADSGPNSAFLALTTDSTHVYGTGYVFYGNGGTGNFEGRFGADFQGNLKWLASCHGDTYSLAVQGPVLYSVSHAHDCSDIGAFDDPNPRTWRHALAETTEPSGATELHNTNPPYSDFAGQPTNTLLHWFPELSLGKFTGQNQAAWSVATNSQYVVLGGEFPKVNGAAQQGLVRFALPSVTTPKVKPLSVATLRPTASSPAAGTARVRWQTTWDYDNASITYRLYRDQSASPIYTTTVNSTFWDEPWLGFVDTGLTPGSQHTYRITATDPNGNVTSPAASAAVTISGSSPTTTAYDADVVADGATQYWHLNESSGGAGYSSVGWDDLALGSAVTRGAPGPTAGRTATSFAGTSNSLAVVTPTYRYIPDPATLEGWFKTTSTSGGVIMDFGNAVSGVSSRTDQVLYMTNSGNLVFAKHVNTGATKRLLTPGAYNDGVWHHVAATFSPTDGTALYVDGGLVSADASDTTTYPFEGFWRVGGDSVPSGGPLPASPFFAGALADLAIYPTALAAPTVQQHYADSGVSAPSPPSATNASPTASFTISCTGLSCSFNGSGSWDDDGSIASYSWDFGDGATASGALASHTFAAGGNSVTLTVTDNASNTGSVTRTAPLQNFAGDSFNRTVAGGWGTADLGGAWATTGAASVAPAAGTLTSSTAGSTASAVLAGVSQPNADLTATFTTNKTPTGGGQNFYLVGRRSSANNEYRALVSLKSNGTVTLAITKLDGSSTEVVVAPAVTVAGLTYSPGVALSVRFSVSGSNPTTLLAKVWRAGQAQPASWTAFAQDVGAGIQAPGAVGLRTLLSSTATNSPTSFTVTGFTAATAA